MHSLEDEIKRLSGEGRNIDNVVVVTKIWGEICGYALPILVLFEELNDSKDFRITLKQYFFF